MSKDSSALMFYALDVTEALSEPADEFINYVPPERRGKIKRLRSAADQARTLWAELLARILLSKISNRPFQNIVIFRDRLGKPHCRDEALNFSLSHSGSWVLCAAGRAECGADVEKGRVTMDIAARWFQEDEYKYLAALPKSDREKKLLSFWTLKESYLKLTGEGLSGGLDSVSAMDLLAGTGRVAGRSFVLPDGATASVVANKEALPSEPVIVGADFVLKNLPIIKPSL